MANACGTSRPFMATCAITRHDDYAVATMLSMADMLPGAAASVPPGAKPHDRSAAFVPARCRARLCLVVKHLKGRDERTSYWAAAKGGNRKSKSGNPKKILCR